jgi:3D (Asp-Asp-Asp) domain-containing protein
MQQQKQIGWVGKKAILTIMISGFFISGILIEKMPSLIDKINENLGLIKTFNNQKSFLANSNFSIIDGNSLRPVLGLSLSKNPLLREEIVRARIKMIVTGYSSTPDQTDETPYITASGTYVREGLVANNLFPFGTKIKIPEIFGPKIFIVEDRLNPKKSYYHIDVWFTTKQEALNFGKKITYIEILE